MNSILYNICNLRTQFMNSSSAQNDKLQFLSGNVVDLLSTGTLADGIGNVFKVDENLSGGLAITQVCRNGLSVDKTIFNGSLNEWASTVDSYLAGEDGLFVNNLKDVHFSSFLNEAKKGEQTNELLALMLDKYTTNTRAKATDLCNLIDASGLKTSDMLQLKTAISSSADADGLVSNYAMLSLLRNLCVDAQEQLNDGKIAMDDTKIFYVSNFLATAVTTILSSLVTVIGFLLSKVNIILGIIVAAIGFIMNIIGQAFSKIDDKAKVQVSNPLSTVPWFDGPAIAKRLPFRETEVATESFLSSEYVQIREEGGFTTCLWKTDDTSVTINRFLSMNVELNRFSQYIHSVVNTNIYASGPIDEDITYEFSIKPGSIPADPFKIPDSCFMTDEERLEILTNTADQINHYMYQLYLLWCEYAVFCSMVRSGFNTSGNHITVTVGSGSVYSNYTYKVFKVAGSEGKMFAKRLLGAAVLEKALQVGDEPAPSDVDLTLLCIDDYDLMNNCAAYDQLHGSLTDQSFNHWFQSETMGINVVVDTNAIINTCYYDPIACYTSQNLANQFYWYNSQQDLDLSCLPTDRMFKFAAYDQHKMIAAIIAVSAVTAVVLIAGTIAIKAFKKYKWKKQYDRKIAVQKAKEDYDDQPTTENFNALYKAQKSYNFRAKLFGWDSYDASNDWFDAAETGNLSSFNDQDYTLADIINLIH